MTTGTDTGTPAEHSIRNRLAVYEHRLQRLLESHGAEHPAVVSLRDDIFALESELEDLPR